MRDNSPKLTLPDGTILQKVSVNFFQGSGTNTFKELFNQATFFNFDVNSKITVNKWPLQAAVTDAVTGLVYPTFLEIGLNVGEINSTNYDVDIFNSTTANWWVIYTQYLGTS